MKLVKLIVKNFRWLGWDKNIIEFSNSNIIFLIWQNNIWKSTFLRAYEFFVSWQKACRTDFFNHDVLIPIEIEWIFKKEDWDDTDFNSEPDWVNKWVNWDWFIKIKKLWNEVDKKFEKYTFSPPDNDWKKNGFWWIDWLFTKYSPTAISINAMETEETLEAKVNKLIQDEFLKKVETDFSTEYNTALDSIKELQSKILWKEELEQFNENLNINFKKLFSDLTLKITEKNDKIKIEDILKKEHIVSVTKDWQSFSEDIKSNWHWIIRQALFNFLTFLKNNISWDKKQYIILFEEPELYLHPKIILNLRKSLYKLSENSPFQILCASHSPMMIDISKEHSSLVRIIKNWSENTETYQVWDNIFRETDEMKNFIQMINRFNPHVCESFYADKVLLVEWDTEAIVFRDLLDRFFPKSEIFVLNTGSKNNITFFQKILRHFNIEYIVVHDADTEFTYDNNWDINTNSDWSNTKNSAWKINENIQNELDLYGWKWIRYVNIKDFETENNYYINNEWKAVSAYNFVKELDLNSDKKCIEFLKYIVWADNCNEIHNQEYIGNNRYNPW